MLDSSQFNASKTIKKNTTVDAKPKVDADIPKSEVTQKSPINAKNQLKQDTVDAADIITPIIEKNSSKGIDKPLLPTEGKVGTFKELAKQGTAFDNITPHHIPSAAKMKQVGVKRNDGVSMNMEHPHPGVGGRHRETYTYGLSGDKLEKYLDLSYRDALAHDILDARRIYMKDGVYTPEIRAGLLNTIRKNRELYSELFNK